MSFIRLFARVLPKNMRESVNQMIGFSTFKTSGDAFIGWAITLGIVLSFAVTLVGGTLEYPPLLVFLASFILLELVTYLWLSLNISSKAHQVDTVLPDALQLMSSNIRAGLTTDKALLMSARPEFGHLEEEIRRVGKETMAGRNLTDALSRMPLHIKSEDLSRTVELVVNSIKSGGQLADILDQTAEDLREQQIIRKEISASVLMYILFICIAITMGAPALYAMSSFLVELLAKNMALISKDMPKDFAQASSMPIKMTGKTIDPAFIHNYAIISIAVSCILGSMIMGLILRGEEKEGFKFTLPMLVIAEFLFWVASQILNFTIGGMMPH
jgi:archaeal flagellar protein FlaJ